MKSVGTVTVDLKIKGIGGSHFGVWLIGAVARVFKIELEVISVEGKKIQVTSRTLDELQEKTEKLFHEIERLRTSSFSVSSIPSCSEAISMPECEPQKKTDWNDRTGQVSATMTNIIPKFEPSQQHTKCAVCLIDKPTPIRNDVMGGYVCLTCVDKELERLQGLNT